MIRWALVFVSAFAASAPQVTVLHIYDSPDDCELERSHRKMFADTVSDKSESHVECIEIDGNKSPQPQVNAKAHRAQP